MSANPDAAAGPARVALVDAMAGVRDAWRWLLHGVADVRVVGEAASVAEAAELDGDVLLTGLRLADGTAADLVARAGRPVIVWSFLPPDEIGDLDLSGAAAVLWAGTLREGLVAAIRQAAGVADG